MFLFRWRSRFHTPILFLLFVVVVVDLLRIDELDAFLLVHVPRRPLQTTAVAASLSIPIAPASSVLDTNTVIRIEEIIKARSQARWNGDYELADQYRNQLDQEIERRQQQHLIPCGLLRIQIQDQTRQQGGGSQWTLHYDIDVDDIHPSTLKTKTVLQMAHQLLGMTASYSMHGRHYALSFPFDDQWHEIVQQTKQQLPTRRHSVYFKRWTRTNEFNTQPSKHRSRDGKRPMLLFGLPWLVYTIRNYLIY